MTPTRYQHVWKVFVAITLLTGIGFAADDDSAKPQPKPRPKQSWIRPGFEFRLEVGGGAKYSVGPIPLSYRQIPHHPDDPNYSFTIPDQPLVPKLDTIGLGFTPSLTFWSFITVRAGVLGQPGFRSYATDANFLEINQFGTSERGYGTSLVYITAKARPSSLPGYLGEVELPVVRTHNNFSYSLIGGYAVSNFSMDIERGYDRYDAHQKLDAKPYSHNSLRNPYVGLRIGLGQDVEPVMLGLSLLAGPMFIRTTPVSDLNLSPYSASTNWSVRVALYVGFIKTKQAQ